MSGSRISAHLLTGALIAAVGTASLLAAWRAGVSSSDEASALRWARQVAAQAEGLAFAGRTRGEDDPVGQAVSALSQGVEPRAVRVWKATGLASQDRETYQFHEAEGVFEYVRLITPEKGLGVRVRVQMDRRGVFGLPVGAASDFAVFLVFAFLWAAVHHVLASVPISRRLVVRETKDKSDSERYESLVDGYLLPAGAELARLERLRSQQLEMREALSKTGTTVRDLLRSTRELLAGALKAQGSVESARTRIHRDLKELSDARKSAIELTRSMIDSELASLHTLVEATRREGRDPSQILSFAAQVHESAVRVRALNEKIQRSLLRLEIDMEPFATDADVAFQSLESSVSGAKVLDEQIRATAESLVRQATVLRKIEQELSEKSASEPREPEPKALVA
jgi:hypothetical protein